MAAIPHINKRRGGVWYYERRVPLSIRAQPSEHRRIFRSKALWRQSLRTESEPDALERGLAAALEFEALLATFKSSGADLRTAPQAAANQEAAVLREIALPARGNSSRSERIIVLAMLTNLSQMPWPISPRAKR